MLFTKHLKALEYYLVIATSISSNPATFLVLFMNAIYQYRQWDFRFSLRHLMKACFNLEWMRAIHCWWPKETSIQLLERSRLRGVGYPDLWPSPSCKEPLDVSKNFTFDVISGILADMRNIFPFKLFHSGGDEVHTDYWTSTPPVKQWLQDHNMTGKDAYQYFVLRAQEIAASLNWIPVNWEETFNTFPTKLNPQTIVHNWLGSGVCPKAVAKGFRCIFSNQGVWYLDHLDVPWSTVYYADPLEGITDASEQKLVLGGEACMWGETADASNVSTNNMASSCCSS